jgi:hypothetical protein
VLDCHARACGALFSGGLFHRCNNELGFVTALKRWAISSSVPQSGTVSWATRSACRKNRIPSLFKTGD